MTTIRLTAPVAMSEFLVRPRLVPGRHLGEDEFDRLQAYADARLAPLTATLPPGILHGLGCEPGVEPARPGSRVLVEPGLAVAGDGQLVGLFIAAQATWAALLTDWLRVQRTDDASGVYYLTLQRGVGVIDAGVPPAPCQRAEPDPRRDLRREVLGRLVLRRLALRADGLAAMTPAQVQNQVAALHVDGAFLHGFGGAVPLALLAVSVRPGSAPIAELDPALVDARFRVDWCSPAAGRYLAVPHAGQRVLFEQVQEAWRAALTAAMAPAMAGPDLATALEATLRLAGAGRPADPAAALAAAPRRGGHGAGAGGGGAGTAGAPPAAATARPASPGGRCHPAAAGRERAGLPAGPAGLPGDRRATGHRSLSHAPARLSGLARLAHRLRLAIRGHRSRQPVADRVAGAGAAAGVEPAAATGGLLRRAHQCRPRRTAAGQRWPTPSVRRRHPDGAALLHRLAARRCAATGAGPGSGRAGVALSRRATRT